MTTSKTMRLLRFAAVLAIAALLMILWAIFDSGVIPVMVSMSVGQALGTLSLALYLVVLVADFRRRLGKSGETILKSVDPQSADSEGGPGDPP